MADEIFLQPQNRNLLSALRYRFCVDRIPLTNYFVHGVNIPTITMQPILVGGPLTSIALPGDRIQWDDLKVSFVVDEYLKNWHEIFNWMCGLGHPESLEQYKNIQNATTGDVRGNGLLIVLDSNNNHVLEYNFSECFPISLTGVDFNSQSPDVQYLTSTVTLKYTNYTVRRVKGN